MRMSLRMPCDSPASRKTFESVCLNHHLTKFLTTQAVDPPVSLAGGASAGKGEGCVRGGRPADHRHHGPPERFRPHPGRHPLQGAPPPAAARSCSPCSSCQPTPPQARTWLAGCVRHHVPGGPLGACMHAVCDCRAPGKPLRSVFKGIGQLDLTIPSCGKPMARPSLCTGP